MLLNLLIKRASRDAETLRSLLNAASLLLKDALDVLLFEFLESETGVKERRPNLRVSIEVKVGEGDSFLVT